MNKMLLELGINAKEAENTMRTITTDQKNQVLAAVAGHLVESTDKLLEANAVDVAKAEPHARRSGRSSYVEPGETRRHGRGTQTACGA